MSSFKTNLHVVEESIAKEKKRFNRILFKKVDLVGHSMGGILSRLHVQYVDKTNVHKIVTVNTPHSGSEWGDIMSFLIDKVYNKLVNINLKETEENKKRTLTLLDKIAELAFGVDIHTNDFREDFAVYDLAVNSEATDYYLNGLSDEGNAGSVLDEMNGIPIRAITTTLDFKKFTWGSILFSLGILRYGKKNLSMFEFLGILTELNIKLNESDWVVSLESQKGGLEGASAPNASKNQIHVGSASNDGVISDVQQALRK